jgi:putrescine transport system substrate-binding protein
MSVSPARRAAAVILALALAACSRTPTPSATLPAGQTSPTAQTAPALPSTPGTGAEQDSEKILNVYNWSDYIDPTVIPEFEKQYGIKVHYDVFDSNEVLETKLLAGHTGYDVVVPSASFLERQIQAGVFQKLDKSRLPNLKYVDPELAARVAVHDPGNAYAVIYLWGTSGNGYEEGKIKAVFPTAPVDSFRMLYDPAVVSKFKDCGVSILDAPDEVVESVLVFLGRDPNSESSEDLAAAEAVLHSIRPYVRYVNSSRYIDDLANGEICLALGWSGDVLQARDRAREAGKGLSIRYAIPREGAVMFFDMLAIPADAPHPLNAHLFIDFLQRPEIAARNSNFVRYASGNAAARPLMREDVSHDPGIYPPPEVAARLHPNRAHSPQYTRALTRAWTRFKTGQ